MGKFYNIKIIDIPNDHVYKVIGAFLAEFFGSLFLTCLGCMGLIVSKDYNYVAGINFGLVLMIVIEAFSYISVGVLNPALVWCALICQKINCGTCFCYLIAQFSGAICGYAILFGLIPHDRIQLPTCDGICVTMPRDVSTLTAFGIEFFITWVLTWVYCTHWCSEHSYKQDSSSLRIGLIFGFLFCISSHYTGGSMNPARSLAAALFNKCWDNHWIYWAGPFAGSILGSLFYKITVDLECTTEHLGTQVIPKL